MHRAWMLLLAACSDDFRPPLSVEVVGEAPQWAMLGDAVEIELVVSGGEPPFIWTRSGRIPGLFLEHDGGRSALLTGVTTSPGTFNVSVSAHDEQGASGSTLLVLTVNGPPPPVPPPPVPDPPGILTERIHRAVVDRDYAAVLEASGGEAPLGWSMEGAPPGLEISPIGWIEGVPTATGTFSIRVVVEDALQRADEAVYELPVLPELLVVTSTLPSGFVDVPYRAQLEAAGGLSPYSWWQTFGGLVAGGLYVTGDRVEGTPAVRGSFTFGIFVSDSAGQTEMRTLSIRIF